MQLKRQLAGFQRGRPVWHALVALVLLPGLVVAVLGGLSVHGAARDAARAADAQERVAAIAEFDQIRRAVDAEVLPTLLMVVLRDEAGAAAVGFPAARRAALLTTEPAHLATLRATTDDAVRSVEVTARSSEVLQAAVAVREQLTAARTEADTGSGLIAELADAFADASDLLATAQRRASAEALAANPSTSSAMALQDLDQTLVLGQLASQQLPLLFASRVMSGTVSERTRREWLASWGAYTEQVDRGSSLSSQRMREAWTSVLTGSSVKPLSDALDRQALHSQSEVLVTVTLPGLSVSSEARDAAVAVLLADAVDLVTAAAETDRAAAVATQRQIVVACILLLLLSLATAVLVSHCLARSLSALAAWARQVSQGHLVEVPMRGPRELRTAGDALSATVAGLRRVQEQASAMASGDLQAALRVEPLPGPLGEVVHASVQQVVRVIQAREELQDELAHRAAHDTLTGLANRAQTLTALTEALERGRTSDLRTGLLFLDLDGFKAVNDTHGHAVGDALLKVVAERLVTIVRGTDVVGRLGGDEFVVLVTDATTAEALMSTGERLIAELSRPVAIEDDTRRARTVRVGASVGVAMSSGTGTGTSADVLLAEADAAAYRAKSLGRGRVELYDDALREELSAHAALEKALTTGLADGELVLHYQPVIHVVTGAVLGHEALVRWQRPGHGLVGPDVFVPVAEASSLVCDLGRWVLGEATAQMARWRASGVRVGDTVAVNLSARHLLEPRVVDDVAAALAAAVLPASALVVEITETVLVDDPQVGVHLTALRELGVRVAIDDFGTGYTSIAALSTTPADILKIDMSFVRTDDPRRHQLAAMMVHAARTFGMEVIAEGVETPEQLARATAHGCLAAQGWLFSRALPADEVIRPRALA